MHLYLYHESIDDYENLMILLIIVTHLFMSQIANNDYEYFIILSNAVDYCCCL